MEIPQDILNTLQGLNIESLADFNMEDIQIVEQLAQNLGGPESL